MPSLLVVANSRCVQSPEVQRSKKKMYLRHSSSLSCHKTSNSASWTSFFRTMSTFLTIRQTAPMLQQSKLSTSQMMCLKQWSTFLSKRLFQVWIKCANFRMFAAMVVQWSSKTKSKCSKIKFMTSQSFKTDSNSLTSSLGAPETISHHVTEPSQLVAVCAPSQHTALFILPVEPKLLALGQQPQGGSLEQRRARNQLT